MMKRFLSGFLVGTVATVAAAASVVMIGDEQQADHDERRKPSLQRVSLQ